jgi:hypothetical protein
MTKEEFDEEFGSVGPVRRLGCTIDQYCISDFAQDDPERFHQLVSFLCPRDQEIMLCFAVLQKRPVDISRVFGKAGHRAEEDLHKAAHKLAGLVAFGTLPGVDRLDQILRERNLHCFGGHSFAACLWQYARNRDFNQLSRLVGPGLHQHMLRTFKQLHAKADRESGLLAGWILWLVDGSNPHGKGWRKRKRTGCHYKLGPTVFRSAAVPYGDYLPDGSRPQTTMQIPKATGPNVVKIQRYMKFILRGMNA